MTSDTDSLQRPPAPQEDDGSAASTPQQQEPASERPDGAGGRLHAPACEQAENAPIEPLPQPDGPTATAPKRLALPNAMVGRAYETHVALSKAGSAAPGDFEAAGLGEIGLSFDPATGRVHGVPLRAGDFSPEFVAAASAQEAARIRVAASLTVNQDPRALWTDQPSDPSGRWAKPDTDRKVLREDGLLCAAASRRGRSHARDGGYREDDVEIGHTGVSGWWLLAAADGAGSAAYSRRGSQIAVKETLAQLVALLPQHADEAFLAALEGLADDGERGGEAQRLVRGRLYELLVRAAHAAALAVEREAAREGEEARQFATTLLLAMHRRCGDRHFVAAFGIGDGGVALLHHGRDGGGAVVVPLTSADSGEFAGQTRFLATSEFASAEDTIARLRFRLVDRLTALLVMTDGVTDPRFPTEASFADPETWRTFWDGELAPEVDPTRGDGDEALGERLLAWLDFYTPSHHDDRSIIVLMPAPR